MNWLLFQCMVSVTIMLMVAYTTFFSSMNPNHVVSYNYPSRSFGTKPNIDNELKVTIPEPSIVKCPYKNKNYRRCVMVLEYIVDEANPCNCHDKAIKVSYKIEVERWFVSCEKEVNKSGLLDLIKLDSNTSTPAPPHGSSCQWMPQVEIGTVKRYGYLTQEGTIENEPVNDTSTCPLILR